MNHWRIPLAVFILVGLAIYGAGIPGNSLAGDFSGSPKLSPLYPPPPYLVTQSEHLLVVFEADAASIRELLPPGIEPAPGNTILLNMYRAANVVGLGPYTATYLVVNIEGFDSPDGTKGRYMVYGWYGPYRMTAALREVFGLPVKLGETRHEREGNQLRAVLSEDGNDLIEATIKIKGESSGRIGGFLNYPVLKQSPAAHGTQAAVSELINIRIPYTGEVISADPVSVVFKLSEQDPIRRLEPKRLLGAFYFKGTAFEIGYTDVVKQMK